MTSRTPAGSPSNEGEDDFPSVSRPPGAPRLAFLQDYESAPWSLPHHKIFISHSGMQKDFAKQLCKDLHRAGYYPFFDLYGYCLPKGEKFPEILFEAARHCLLAILLLTPEFFTKTKWPMQELAAFVRARRKDGSRPDMRILPVLLAISSDDLKHPAHWLPAWEEWAKKDRHVTHEVICEWKDAILALKPFNHISIRQGEGDVDVRERIVASVMETIPPDVRSSVLHVQGRERICKELKLKFNTAETSNRSGKKKVLAMFGIGGAGKSTACRIITESLRIEFSGRVCHVEFKPETSIVKLQCTVLRELIRDNEVFLDKHIDDEHKGWNRLEESMHRYKVFLALDNVSDSTVETARRFLCLKFHMDSWVLVTSRSAIVLFNNLAIPESDCFPCPKLNAEEARHVILDRFNLSVQCLSEAHMQILNRALKLSFFDDGYHPLALTLFAGQLQANRDDWKISNLDMQECSQQEHPLFSIIETSYTSLPTQQLKDLFLDVALFTPEGLCSTEEISVWLNHMLYHESDGTHSEGDGVERIKRKLNVLRAKSLLEVWTPLDNETVRVHDFYRQLAERKSSPEVSDHHMSRFIYQRKGPVCPTVLLDSHRARIIERAAFVEAQFEVLELAACTNLQVLSVRKCRNLLEVGLQGLGCLVSLELNGCPLKSLNLSGLKKLRWLHISSCNNLMALCVSGLVELRSVSVSKCSTVTKVKMMSCFLVMSVSVLYNDNLESLSLGDSQRLGCLILWFCKSLSRVEVNGLAYPTIFKKKGCPLLWCVQGSEIIHKDLEWLCLESWGKLSHTCISYLKFSESLQVLDIWHCALSRLPDLRQCSPLREFKLSDVDVLLYPNDSKLLREYDDLLHLPSEDLRLPVNLEYISIENCRIMVIKEVFRNLQGLRELRWLSLGDVRVGWDWELYRYTDGLYKPAYMDLVLDRSSTLDLLKGLAVSVQTDASGSVEQKVEGFEDDDEIFELKNKLGGIHACIPLMPVRSEAEIFGKKKEDIKNDGVGFLYKTVIFMEVFFVSNRKPTELEQLVKGEIQSQLTKFKQLLSQWEKFETEPSLPQHERVGQLFWDRMDEAVQIRGSPCWVVEQMILETCDSYDAFWDFLCQHTAPSSNKILRGLCQRIAADEIRKQLIFVMATDCMMQQEWSGLEKWERMVYREVASRKKTITTEFIFGSRRVSAMPRLQTLVKRLYTLSKWRKWNFTELCYEELGQVARDWLGACDIFMSMESLKDFLATRNERGKTQVQQEMEDLGRCLKEIRKLLCKFNDIFNDQIKEIRAWATLDSSSSYEILVGLMRCWKVYHWFQQLESCLCVKDVLKLKKPALFVTHDIMLMNEMCFLVTRIQEKLALSLDQLERIQLSPSTTSCRKELCGKAASLEVDLKQAYPNIEFLYYLLEVAGKIKERAMEKVEAVNRKTDGFLEDVGKEMRIFASRNSEMDVGWQMKDMLVSISRLKIRQTQCLKLVSCSVDLADRERMQELWERTKTLVHPHMWEDWKAICGEHWASLAQEALTLNIESTWEWTEVLLAKLTGEIQFMELAMCPSLVSSIQITEGKARMRSCMERIQKLVFLVIQELMCVEPIIAQLADLEKSPSLKARMEDVRKGRLVNLMALLQHYPEKTVVHIVEECVGEPDFKRLQEMAINASGARTEERAGKLRALVVGGGDRLANSANRNDEAEEVKEELDAPAMANIEVEEEVRDEEDALRTIEEVREREEAEGEQSGNSVGESFCRVSEEVEQSKSNESEPGRDGESYALPEEVEQSDERNDSGQLSDGKSFTLHEGSEESDESNDWEQGSDGESFYLPEETELSESDERRFSSDDGELPALSHGQIRGCTREEIEAAEEEEEVGYSHTGGSAEGFNRKRWDEANTGPALRLPFAQCVALRHLLVSSCMLENPIQELGSGWTCALRKASGCNTASRGFSITRNSHSGDSTI